VGGATERDGLGARGARERLDAVTLRIADRVASRDRNLERIVQTPPLLSAAGRSVALMRFKRSPAGQFLLRCRRWMRSPHIGGRSK
jgi:hypothetical protein